MSKSTVWLVTCIPPLLHYKHVEYILFFCSIISEDIAAKLLYFGKFCNSLIILAKNPDQSGCLVQFFLYFCTNVLCHYNVVQAKHGNSSSRFFLSQRVAFSRLCFLQRCYIIESNLHPSFSPVYKALVK